MEWLRTLLASWKVRVALVGGAVVVATSYGTCTVDPEAVSETTTNTETTETVEVSTTNTGAAETTTATTTTTGDTTTTTTETTE